MKNCIVCGGPIPANRGARATTCSKEHSAAIGRQSAKSLPDRRLYDYPETEYTRAIGRLGWSQVDAAKLLGIDPRTSRRLAAGDIKPSVPLITLLRLAVHLKMDETEFDPDEEPVMVLVRAIFRHKIGESRFFELAAKPIK